MLDDRAGVFYGVQVQERDGSWRTRYGWFEEDAEDGLGLERAQQNLERDRDYESKRIVRRTVKTEVVP